MKNAIIILNYNNSKETIAAIENIDEIKAIDNIVVVDNNSDKENLKFLEKFIQEKIIDENIVLLKNKKNLGYANGNNTGLFWLKNNHFIGNAGVMNPDVRVTENSFDVMVKTLEYIGQDAFIAPTNNTDDMHWDFSNPESDLKSKFRGIPHTRNHDSEIMGEFPTKYKKVEVLSGAFLFANINVWNKVGFYDRNTFLYFEEDILQHKANVMGISSFVAVEATMTHKGKSSTDIGKAKIRKICNYEKRLNESRFYFYDEYLNTPRDVLKRLKLYRKGHLVGKAIKAIFEK